MNESFSLDRFMPAWKHLGMILGSEAESNNGQPLLICVRDWNQLDPKSVESSPVYPDKMFLLGKDVFFGVRCCTKPSNPQPQSPVLVPGKYLYTRGIHVGARLPPYMALRQIAPVTVSRNGKEETDDGNEDLFHINIHRGISYVESGSGGCLSIEPAMWDCFISMVDRAMSKANASNITLIMKQFSPDGEWWNC